MIWREYMSDKSVLKDIDSEELEVGLIRKYVIWYEYAQYLLENEKLDKRIYKDWNLKAGQKFDPWWKDNWKLFAHPKRGMVKKITSIPKLGLGRKIYLEIPLDTNSSNLVRKCKTIIDAELSKKKVVDDTSIKSSKFKLDVKENFDYLVWSRRLKCLKMKDKKIRRIDIYDDLRKKKMKVRKSKKERTGLKEETYYPPPSEGMSYWNKVSMVCRDINLAEKFLVNIRKGNFSTKFK
jgi:hypothetical protein